MANSFALRLQGVRLDYARQSVLKDLSLQVYVGEVFGILGRVGAGKTRLLRLIAGLEKPTSGTIENSLREGNSYIFQHDLLIPWLTVEENLRICASPRTATETGLYSELGINEMLAKRPGQLSGGMRKKVNFIRAFLNNQPLLLMDEPFGALDPAEKLSLQKILLRLLRERQTTGVMVTHDIQEALLVCQRIGFLSIKTGNLITVKENPYQGRLDTAQLFADNGYRELTKAALDFFEGERK